MPETEEVVQPIIDEPQRTAETQETEVEAPEAEKPEPSQDSETEHEQERKGKGGFSKKIDKLTARNYQLSETNAQLQARLEAIERRLAGEQAPAKPTESKAPVLDDFKNDPDPWDSYYKALARYEAKQIVEEERKAAEKQTAEQQNKAIFDSYNKRVSEARGNHEDFDEVVGRDDISIPQSVQLAIVEMDNGPEVAYYLGQHPEEAEKLLTLSPLRAVMAVGKISASLTPDNNSPEKRPVTGAPPPVKPVGASSTKSTADLEGMSQRDYNRIMNEREQKRRFR